MHIIVTGPTTAGEGNSARKSQGLCKKAEAEVALSGNTSEIPTYLLAQFSRMLGIFHAESAFPHSASLLSEIISNSLLYYCTATTIKTCRVKESGSQNTKCGTC
jgi:hypothetical protein